MKRGMVEFANLFRKQAAENFRKDGKRAQLPDVFQMKIPKVGEKCALWG